MSVLSRFRWYRRWKGGRWERWYLDVPFCDTEWFHNTTPGQRPLSVCRGTPTVEDYR